MATEVLVTGGAGFIGSHLSLALAEGGYRVRVLDDLSNGVAARLNHENIRLTQGSILDDKALKESVAGVSIIFHEAALVSVPQSMKMPVEYHQVNATGTLRVLQSAREAGVKRLVYAASSSAYGEDPHQPKRESMRALPISPYAVSKYAGELYTTVWALGYGMETISLRYFNVFGPGQDPKSQYGAAIPAIVTRMLKGQRPMIFGDGEQTRDFCFIENVVQANLLAARAPVLNGQVVNIGCGKRTSVNEIVSATNRILGTKIEAEYASIRPGDVRDSLADVSEARRVLRYEPAVHFEEGLAHSIEWYKSAKAGA